MTRSCAATCCARPVKPGMLMCKAHWFSVPARLRNAIWRTWRARHIAAYRENVREAVDFIDNMPGPFEANEGPIDISRTVAIAPDGARIQYEHGRLL